MCDEMLVQDRREAEGILLAREDAGLESKGKLEPVKDAHVLETGMLKLRSPKEKVR